MKRKIRKARNGKRVARMGTASPFVMSVGKFYRLWSPRAKRYLNKVRYKTYAKASEASYRRFWKLKKKDLEKLHRKSR